MNGQHGEERGRLTEALGIPREKGITALVGGGGKTSLLYRLGQEFARRNRPVILTTTTRIGVPEPEWARTIFPREAAELPSLAQPGRVICVGEPGEDGKLHHPGQALLTRCVREADHVLAESDGAKRLPVKLPAAHEPCIPPETALVIAVAGLTALGRPLGEVCFRFHLAEERFRLGPETVLTPELLARFLTSPQGQYKGVEGRPFTVFLNQADSEALTARGLETAAWIRRLRPACRVVVGCLRPEAAVRAVLPGMQ